MTRLRVLGYLITKPIKNIRPMTSEAEELMIARIYAQPHAKVRQLVTKLKEQGYIEEAYSVRGKTSFELKEKASEVVEKFSLIMPI